MGAIADKLRGIRSNLFIGCYLYDDLDQSNKNRLINVIIIPLTREYLERGKHGYGYPFLFRQHLRNELV
jgi:hypothetical protein